MSGTVGAVHSTAMPGLGLDASRRWHLRGVRKGRAMVKSYVLPSSGLPPPSAGGGRTPVRLPSLVATAVGPHRRCTRALLSHSEPSLLIPDENALLERLSSHRRPSVAPKRTPPPTPPFSKSSVRLSCETGRPPTTSLPRQPQNRQQVQSCSRPAYIHFSQAIPLGPKPRPVRSGFHPPSLSPELVHSDLTVRQCHSSLFQGEPLSVVGRPCLLSYTECLPLAAAATADSPARTQLHVFLPTEDEGEEGSASVDEGFMDEVESKITSLKLQHGAPMTPIIPPML
ncbi:uncharacterized protein AB9W97_001047 [Spinachia spinachia]